MLGVLVLAAPLTAAGEPRGQAYVAPGLLAAAERSSERGFAVIVQGTEVTSSGAVAAVVRSEVQRIRGSAKGVRRQFATITGVSAHLTGRQIAALAGRPGILAITPDAPVRALADIAPASASPPTITGTAVEGQTLTAAPGEWTGTAPIAYGHQWRRCDAAGAACADIAGATGGSYLLSAADVGSTIRVAVTASNAAGATEAVSAATAVVAAPPPLAPVNTTPPVIAGTAEEGQTLTGSDGLWSGTFPIAYAYQWRRCDATGGACVDVAAATGATYVVAAADVGATIRVAVTASNVDGAATAVSEPTAAIRALVIAPASTSPPTIAGTAEQGQTLSGTPGAWTGTAPISYAYRWRRCDAAGGACVDIAGATGDSYLLSAADVGATIRVAVTASNAAGASEAVSAATAAVAAAVPPAVSSAPGVSGAAKDGATLTAGPGTWTGSGPLAYAYQWQRCGTAYRDTVLADSPIGYWRLGEATESLAADETPAARTGTYGIGVTRGQAGATGDRNAAAGFDGNAAVVDVPGIPNTSFASGFTLEIWVRAAARQTDRGLLGKWRWDDGGGVLLWINDNGYYTLAVNRGYSNYVMTTVAPRIGRWDHVVGTWDGVMLRLYVNGVEVGWKSFAGSVGEPSLNFQIGNYGGALPYFFDGALDEAALYDRALSADRIRGHYEQACRDVPGADSSEYALGPADLRQTVRVLVTATNAAGSVTAISGPTDPVAAAPPTNGVLPAIAGPAEERETLTALKGTWSGTAPIAHAYQWRRCDAAGTACTPIAGATESSYVVTEQDVGGTLQAVVTATNEAGSVSVVSLATARVADSYTTSQLWPAVSRLTAFWDAARTGQEAPAIAVVDSGIQAGRADFGGRVVAAVTMISSLQNSPEDGRGHGTFVASVAAGEGHGYAGAAPNARLVSVDVLDDTGQGTTSDVIAAADWIYQNKDAYGIRVANLSLSATAETSFRLDPLNKAVEKLWLSGVVVVASAGNYAVDGQQSGVRHAPGDDPFIITVGALDTAGTFTTTDDFTAPWSAWGSTADGFAKPDLSAAGRFIVGAVPASSTLAVENPARVIAPGYMELSGTSLSAPIVAGAAANLLAAHPSWKPDQVKGALMRSAEPLPSAVPNSGGIGEVNAAAANALTDPPNPNEALNAFLIPDPNGGPVPIFDAERWAATASADPTWATATWSSGLWGNGLWGNVYWSNTTSSTAGSDSGSASSAGVATAGGPE